MSCRPCKAARSVLDELDALYPNRDRSSDGICASQQHHKQNPGSDHEPDGRGIAHAVDATHDPEGGPDAQHLVDLVVARRDHRAKYLIHNGRIWRSYDKPGLPAWTPQAYTGPIPHVHHCHISIKTEFENDTSLWFDEGDDDMTEAEKQDFAKAIIDGTTAAVLAALADDAHQIVADRIKKAAHFSKAVADAHQPPLT